MQGLAQSSDALAEIENRNWARANAGLYDLSVPSSKERISTLRSATVGWKTSKWFAIPSELAGQWPLHTARI